jgi:hypothetical protein
MIPHHAQAVCRGKACPAGGPPKHHPKADPTATKTKMLTRDSTIIISGAWENPWMLNLVNMVCLRIG